jgi:hypothetical protein
MDELQKAIEAWAVKYAKLYKKMHREEPKDAGAVDDWSETVIDHALEHTRFTKALHASLASAFRKAVG